ncbi:MAG: tripartite tricarboxylate transporter permease [Deinococcota bacterium]|nr:tripartite tricarboxylate transporter permease [Deinococcota bacterium]
MTGILVGALPGLTATLAVSLLVGITYGFDTTLALTMMIGVYVGGVYGGSQTAILLNIPGTPASAASAIEGHQLAKKGLAGQAIGIATISSFIGTIFGAAMLLMASPLLAQVALRFGAWEYFLLAVFGVTICGSLAAANPIKGWVGGFLGLMLAMVGLEQFQAFPRFTFGYLQLNGGISLIPAMIGLFAIPEVILGLASKEPASITERVGNIIPSWRRFKKHLPTTFRSGLIGTVVGIIPGAGEDIAAWVSYANAKRFSKEPEKYGTGSEEGLVACEVANNTCVGGALIPLLTLAIPGGSVSAVILGALYIHNVRPGPLLFHDQPQYFYQIVAMLILSAVFMTGGGLLAAKLLPLVLKTPAGILMPIIAVLCVIGAYAVSTRMFDVYLMLAFGLFGYFLKRNGYTPAPIVLGLILGTMADDSLRRALFLANGSLVPFFTRPISLVLLLFITLTVASSLLKLRPEGHALNQEGQVP